MWGRPEPDHQKFRSVPRQARRAASEPEPTTGSPFLCSVKNSALHGTEIENRSSSCVAQRGSNIVYWGPSNPLLPTKPMDPHVSHVCETTVGKSGIALVYVYRQRGTHLLTRCSSEVLVLAGFVPEGQFHAIPQTEFVIDGAKVVFDYALSGSDDFSNFAIFHSLSNERDDLPLSLAGDAGSVEIVSRRGGADS
jgi:hypothetical protein